MVNLRPKDKLKATRRLNLWAHNYYVPLLPSATSYFLDEFERKVKKLDFYYSRRRWMLDEGEKLSRGTTFQDKNLPEYNWTDSLPEWNL